MPYYWSSTCRDAGAYGGVWYSSSNTSGCGGHNDYAGSKIKEVDGYKIRLLTNVKHTSFVYQNYGFNIHDTDYWTMTSYPDASRYVWIVTSVNGELLDCDIRFSSCVCPVINLLKSKIPDQS